MCRTRGRSKEIQDDRIREVADIPFGVRLIESPYVVRLMKVTSKSGKKGVLVAVYRSGGHTPIWEGSPSKTLALLEAFRDEQKSRTLLEVLKDDPSIVPRIADAARKADVGLTRAQRQVESVVQRIADDPGLRKTLWRALLSDATFVRELIDMINAKLDGGHLYISQPEKRI